MLRQTDDGPLEREPILNTPALVVWIIGILGAVFLVQSLLPDPEAWLLINSFGVVPARYFGHPEFPATLLPGAWAGLVPLLSYSLLHGSPIHLLMNIAWLLAIGTPVAQRLGTARFLIFAAVTAIGGALFYILLQAGSTAPMIGASGAISGLFGGLGRFMFGRRTDGGLDRRALAFAVAWLAINMVVGLSGMGAESGTSAIAWEAHAGGFIAGLALFPLFDRPRNKN